MIGLIKGFVFTGIGMFLGGPFGALIGLFIACASQDNNNYNYYHNNNVTGFSVKCPFCKNENIIENDGNWNCYSCSETFTYKNGKILREEENFLFLTMAIFSKMAKVNGTIVQEQITIIDSFLINSLELNANSRKLAIKYFNNTKDNNVSFQSYCQMFKQNVDKDNEIDNKYELYIYILTYLYQLANINNKISFEANGYLNSVVGIFKISPSDYTSIKCEFGNEIDDKYYKILGCKKGDSIEIIKSQYRKLAKQYHPDIVNTMQVSENIKETLIEKFKEIQEAYSKFGI